MGLGDYSSALEMKAILQRLVAEEIDRQRPRHRFAIVDSIDTVNNKCDVTQIGDSTSVTVAMGAIQPTAVGQRVRIEGLPGDRYITDVVDGSVVAGGGGGSLLEYTRGPAYGGGTSTWGPTEFVRTYKVVSGATQSIPLSVYPTISTAIAQILIDIKATLGNVNADYARPSPNEWRQIIVYPGDYNETFTVPNFVAIASSTQDYRDVRVWHAGDTGTGALMSTTGATCHISGITFDFTGDDENWHPWRDSGAGGDVDNTNGRKRRTVIVEKCKMLVSSATAKQGCAGLDALWGPGVFAVIANNVFQQDNGVQVINSVTGSQNSAAVPSTIVFIDNYLRFSITQRAGFDNPVFGLNDPSVPVGLVDFGGGAKDTQYWHGGTWEFGNPPGYLGSGFPGTKSAVTGYLQTVIGSTQNVKFFIDPDLPDTSSDGTQTFTNVDPVEWYGAVVTGNKRRTKELPPMPLGGLSRETRDAYGITTQTPNLADQDAARILPALASTRASLVANRIYYVRIPAIKAFEVGRITIGTNGAKGVAMASAIYADNGSGTGPDTNANLRVAYSVVTPVNNTDRAIVGEATVRRPFYPLHGYVWVAFVTSSATPTYDTSTTQTDYPVVYQDSWGGSTLGTPTGTAALTAGNAFPLPILFHYELSSAVVASLTTGNFFYGIPSQAKALDITAIGGGGHGASGRRGASSTIRAGGGGGSGGGITRQIVPVSNVKDIIVQFLAGGSAGAARTTDDTDGQNGGGGVTVIVKTNSSIEFMRASGGSGGTGGTATAGAGGTSAGGAFGSSGAGGAANVAGNGNAGGSVGAMVGAPGGGSGGSLTAANVSYAGGGGGTASGVGSTSAASGGGNTGGTGGTGSDPQHGAGSGGGGGGGGASAAGVGGSGGNGGSFGAGGGGGGASVNGQNSGAGGSGGAAAVIIVPMF